MKKLLAPSTFLAVIALPLALAGPSCAATRATSKATTSTASISEASTCTAANGQACTYGNWIVYNNTWGPSVGTYVLHAKSQGNWSVTARQNGGGGCGGCAVEAFDSSQWNYSKVPALSVKYLYSSFSESMPTGSLKTNGVDAEAAYDMFLNGSDTNEIMVWVDNQGQTPAGSKAGVAVIFGQKFDVYVAGSTKSFVLQKNETSGTVHYRAILGWLHTHGMLASSDTLSQFNFGFEICNTGATARTFTVNNLTLHQRL